VRQRRGQPGDQQREEDAIDSDMPEFWNVDRMPEAAPRCLAGTLLMIALYRRANTRASPLHKMIRPNSQYGKLTGRSSRPVNAAAPTSRRRWRTARPVTVGQVPDRPGDQEPRGQRQHVDAAHSGVCANE